MNKTRRNKRRKRRRFDRLSAAVIFMAADITAFHEAAARVRQLKQLVTLGALLPPAVLS